MATRKVGTSGLSRRHVLVGGGVLLSSAALRPAHADEAPLGTYPAGTAGGSVFVGICVPLTGTYAEQGADLQKGIELAIAHLNNGDELMRKISTLTTKGVLGKQIAYGIADSEAKPATAVQAQSTFIVNNEAILMIGSVSSAVAVALNKLADHEKVIYLSGISGANDTTGKDCARYSFRACDYAYTAAAAISPVIGKALGGGRKVAYLTPDYSYGHSVRDSMAAFTSKYGWTTVTDQVCPLGAHDYSAYLLKIAESGADVLININFGNDAVKSIRQSAQFGIMEKMKMVVPYNAPFLSRNVGAELMQGIYATTEFWWTMADRNPLAKMFVDAFRTKYGYNPEWGAHTGYMQIALWADAVEHARSFYPPAVIKSYEDGREIETDLGKVHWRAADHQLVRPVLVTRGKRPADMTSPDDFYEILEIVPGEGLMQPPDAFGCKLGSYT